MRLDSSSAAKLPSIPVVLLLLAAMMLAAFVILPSPIEEAQASPQDSYSNMRDPTYCEAVNDNWTDCDNAFSSNDAYAYANGSTVQGPIVSVERFQVWLDAVATDFRELTLGQDISNTVPFLSKSISGIGSTDYWQHFAVEATFTSTPTDRVVLTRNGATGNLTVYVTVVEFNPSIIKVQSGTFSLTSGSTSPSIPEAVTLAKTALIFYYQTTDATDDHTDNRVRGNITSTTQLTFNVQGTTGTKSGTWWVMESLDATWDVQVRDLAFASSDTSQTATISSVDVAKTFLITSWDTSESSDDSMDGSLQVNLTSSTVITGTRPGAPAATLNAIVFAVTFSGDETVQRKDMTFTTQTQLTDTISSVDLTKATIFATTHDAEFPIDTTSSPLESSFVRFWLTSSTGVQGDRAAGAAGGTMTWQVIEWVTTAVGGGNDTAWLNYGYALNVTDTIDIVEVGIEVYRTAALNITNVSVSWDAGTTWATQQTATNKSSDDDTVEWLNFTSEITWMPWHLSDANLRTRAVTNGSDQRLDYLPVRVNFTTHTSTEADYNPSNCKAYQTANWTNCDDAFSSNDIYAYANGSAAVGILTSLESFTISLSTTATSNSASLTKGQVTANSVPFGTRRMVTSGGTADNYNSMMIDLYFSGSTIVVERFAADAKAIDSVVYVVEFEPTQVSVQQGTFTIAASAASTTESVTAVDQTKAGMVFYYRTGSTTANEHDENAVRGYFSADNQLTFERGVTDSAGSITGNWYIFEDLGTNFDVESVDFNIPSAQTSGTGTIASVTTGATFVIASHEMPTLSDPDGLGYGSIRVDLQDSTTIRAIRATGDVQLDITAFAVEFLSGVADIQRGLVSWTGDTAATDDDTITEVNLSNSFAWSPIRYTASYSLTGLASSDNIASQLSVELLSATTVRSTRLTDGGADPGESAWEVIEFSGTGGGVAGNDTEWFNYGIDIGPEEVFLVKVGVEWYRTSNEPVLQVTISWDGNTTWSANQTATNKSSDDDTAEILDFTNATTWDWMKLEDGNLTVRAHTNASDGRLDHIFVRILYDTPPPIGVVCQDLTVVVNDPAGQLWFNGTTDTPPGGLWQEENVSASYQTLSTPGINVTNDDTEGACDVTLELLSDPGSGRTMKYSLTNSAPNPGANQVPVGSNITVGQAASGATLSIWLWVDYQDSQGGSVSPSLRIDTIIP